MNTPKTTKQFDLDRLSTAMRAIEESPHFDVTISSRERRFLVPYSDMHVWRLERDGKFPKRLTLGDNKVAWSLREIVDWLKLKKAARAA